MSSNASLSTLLVARKHLPIAALLATALVGLAPTALAVGVRAADARQDEAATTSANLAEVRKAVDDFTHYVLIGKADLAQAAGEKLLAMSATDAEGWSPVDAAPTVTHWPRDRSDAGTDVTVVQPAMQVRRLTPTECERLQGFPDGYTNIPWRKKNEAPDGPRYKALGNSMAVPCMQWIGERIAKVEAL